MCKLAKKLRLFYLCLRFQKKKKIKSSYNFFSLAIRSHLFDLPKFHFGLIIISWFSYFCNQEMAIVSVCSKSERPLIIVVFLLFYQLQEFAEI